MAPVLPPEIISRALSIGADIPYRPQSFDWDIPYEVVRADYLCNASLVCRAFALEAQRLLFARPFFRKVADFETFKAAVAMKGRRDVVRGAVFIMESGKKAVEQWKIAIPKFLREFPQIDWIECQTGKAQEKIDIAMFSDVAENLRYLRIRHHSVESPPVSSPLSFPNLRWLDIEGCKLISLDKRDCKPFFSLFPSLSKLQWTTCPAINKAALTKVKKGLQGVSETLTSFEIKLWNSLAEDEASLQVMADIMSTLPNLTFANITIDFLMKKPTLAPTLKVLVLDRAHRQGDERPTISEIKLVQPLVEPLTNLKHLEGPYLWDIESRKNEPEKSAVEAFRLVCKEKGCELYVNDQGSDSSDPEWSINYARQKLPPEPVEEDYDMSEEERGKTKKASMMHFAKILQRTFLQPGGVVEKDLDRCGDYIRWLNGYHIADFDLESKIGYVLRRIGNLPDGRIPAWAEEKYWFRRFARSIHSISGDLVSEGVENID